MTDNEAQGRATHAALVTEVSDARRVIGEKHTLAQRLAVGLLANPINQTAEYTDIAMRAEIMAETMLGRHDYEVQYVLDKIRAKYGVTDHVQP